MQHWLEQFLGLKLSVFWRYTIVLFLPWVALVLLGFFSIPFLEDYAKEVIGFGLFSFGLLSLSLLLNHNLWRRWLSIISVVILIFFFFFKITFYWEYDTKVSVSAMFVIFETNGAEASDFLKNYFDWKAIVLLFVGLFYIYFTVKWLLRTRLSESAEISPQSRIRLSRALVFGLATLTCFYLINWKFQEENIPFTVISSYGEYQETKALLKDELAQPIGRLLNVKSTAPETLTVVVLIGESTTRRHMQLYGYDRQTNPLLSEIRDELQVYDSVISPHVHTITAFDKIMTLQSFEQPKIAQNVSIVQLANQAGFKTYWVSNQRAVGVFESIPTIIGSAASEKYFLNGNAYNDMSLDEKLLPTYRQILTQDAPKKLVFVHLMGTHVGYDKRYTNAYKKFIQEKIKGNAVASKQINDYDNAVLYNDWIVRSFIDELKKVAGPKKLLYFSDHGDDVYDVHNTIGHNEYKATRPMYEVPFILWEPRGDSAKDSLAIKQRSRRYSLDDFEHSFAQFSEFSFDGFEASKSLFSESFVQKKRIIKDTIDYDNWQKN